MPSSESHLLWLYENLYQIESSILSEPLQQCLRIAPSVRPKRVGVPNLLSEDMNKSHIQNTMYHFERKMQKSPETCNPKSNIPSLEPHRSE